MPSQERIQKLISLAEAFRNIEAYRAFYADEMVAQDNRGPERVGLEANIRNAEEFQKMVAQVNENRALSVLVQGDNVVIHWVIDVTLKNGQHLLLDELAYQTWQGDKIVREHFFYDPNAGGK